MKVNQLKIGVALSYVSLGVSTLISIAYTPIMLRLLGQSEYGLYQLVNSVVSYLGLLSFGFGGAYMRFYSRFRAKDDKEGIARLNGMFMIVYIIIGIIALIAGSFLVVNVEEIFGRKLSKEEIETARVLMSLMVFNLSITFPGSVFDSIIASREQYFFQRIINLMRTVLNPFLCLPLLLMGYGSIGMILVATALTILSFLINGFFCLKKLHVKFIFNQFDFGLLKEIAVFSFFIFLNQIIDQINWNVDKFVLGMVEGAVAVAVYALAAQLNSYYLMFSTSIVTVFIPRVNRIVAESNDNKELTQIFTKVGRIQFLLLALIVEGYIFLGQDFIKIWGGPEYGLSYYVGLFLLIPVTVPLIQNLGIEIQRAKNMHKFRSVVYFLIAIGNVCISVPLSIRFGAVGAAIGTALSLLIGNGLIMNWYYHARVGLDMKFFWGQILKLFPALVIPTVTGILIHFYVDISSYLTLFVWIIVFAISYGGSMWCLGLNNFEKNMFLGPIKTIVNRKRN